MTTAAAIGLDYRTANTLWSSVLVETLRRSGLRQAVISPGSRSTPLTMAFVRHPNIECIPVLDERSAAFFALGLAKRSKTPVVLLCTSGTAGANYFPAIIEARESGVPLLVITADRPPEMRECRSGQTIDQQKLFGGYVNFYHELAVPVASKGMLNYLRQTVAHAWEQTEWPEAGPVHLNAPFRDPLAPAENDHTRLLAKSLHEETFFGGLQRSSRILLQAPSHDFSASPRGIIVVGPAEEKCSSTDLDHLEALARNLGWPILADGLSGLRGEAKRFPALITRYDAIVRGTKAGNRLKPQAVLCVGGWPTSKPLRAWLERHSPPVWMITTRRQNSDALHLPTRNLRCSLGSFAATIEARGRSSMNYLEAWQRAESAAVRVLDHALDAARKFEGAAVFHLARNLPRLTPVFVANSMPVRDVEYFWPANDLAHRIYFNRGANGIDGTLSSALGMAHGDRPAVLLTGDLALLHDGGGLLLRPKFKGSLTIVLINNNGGGIFEHLPIARFNPPFEEFFATPQKADFRLLCAAHGIDHLRVRDAGHLATLVRKLPARGIRLLEMRTERKRDAAFRKQVLANAAAAVEQALRE